MSFAGSWILFAQMGEGRKERQSRGLCVQDEFQMPAGVERLLAADGRCFPRPGGSLGWSRSGKLPSYCSHALAGGAATSQFRRRPPFPSNAAELGEFP